MHCTIRTTAAVVLASLAIGAASAETPPTNPGAVKAKAPDVVAPEIDGVPIPDPQELVYTPVKPCRAFFPSTQLPANTTGSYQITGNGNFTSQGGPATGCGVPASATAVTITLTAKSATDGTLTAYAAGTTLPGARSLSYVAGKYYSSGANVALSADGRIAVYTKQTAFVIGEVTGYYAPQIAAYFNYDGTAYAATTRILSTQKLGTGSYQVTTDRNLTYCSVYATIAGGYYYASAYPSGNSAYIQTWAISSGTPTATDLYFMFGAKC